MNLPNSTKLNKKLKSYFERNIKNGRTLLSEVKTINLIHKLSSETINIASTPKVKEILIFEIILNKKELPKELLRSIIIPDIPVLYLLRYEDSCAYAISLLEGKNHLFLEFVDTKNVALFDFFDFSGTNLEKVYHNIAKEFLKNIKDTNIDISKVEFKELLELNNKIETLKKEIQTYQNKISKEKQFKKQLELKRGLKPLQKELETILKEKE